MKLKGSGRYHAFFNMLSAIVQLLISLRRLLLTLFASLRQYSFHFRLLPSLNFHAFIQKSVYSVCFPIVPLATALREHITDGQQYRSYQTGQMVVGSPFF
jgi:hypothetical protein